MSLAIAKPSNPKNHQQNSQLDNLYESDLNLWLETTIAQLKAGDLPKLDIVNLIEELDGLAGRDRRELEYRLTTLLENLLKRCYVKSACEYTGWVRIINKTRVDIGRLIRQSPSLRNYANQPALFQNAFADALRLLRSDPDYKYVVFPDSWLFSSEINNLLHNDFWENP